MTQMAVGARELPDWLWLARGQDSGLGRLLVEFPGVIRDGRVSPTPLCGIMNKFGSDKGNGYHNYTILYHHLFSSSREKFKKIFELGLGTNFPDVPSSMGPNGRPGASLRGWREYFPAANIYGGDIDRRILFQEDRIATYFVDQTRAADVEAVWASVGGDFDVIIDDGWHVFPANRSFFLSSFSSLRRGGYFIIEDISMRPEVQAEFRSFLMDLGVDAALLSIPNARNVRDNSVAVIQRSFED